jgi:ADP-ribosylglycohydrolase
MKGEIDTTAATACLWGCAMGDSLGLPFENLPPGRIKKLLAQSQLKQNFIFGNGMVSDDTEHSLIVARCLYRHPMDPEAFQTALARELRFWIAGCPAGIGLATLRSILKLYMGFAPNRSGVFSAGNGPAMRSAVIGCLVPENDSLRREFTEKSTLITHTDPKAAFGALAISEIAARIARKEWSGRPEVKDVEAVLVSVSNDPEWLKLVSRLMAALQEKINLTDYAFQLGGKKGVSGYVYHTVPFAIACWFLHFGDFEKTIRNCILGGGDTDTTAAICGALAGISCDPDKVGRHQKIWLWPGKHSVFSDFGSPLPGLLKTWIRNIIFFLAILVHCLRRCLPPY